MREWSVKQWDAHLGSESYKKQAGLLKKEGVVIIKGKVIPSESDETKGLDELLLGVNSPIALIDFSFIKPWQTTAPIAIDPEC